MVSQQSAKLPSDVKASMQVRILSRTQRTLKLPRLQIMVLDGVRNEKTLLGDVANIS